MNAKGFTIVESAIVAFIVAVIAAITPSFNGGMAAGLLLVGLIPLVAKLLRKYGVPLLACVALALVQAVVGVMTLGKAASTAPGFGRVIARKHEAAAKASLATLRESLERYKKERGKYPKDLRELTPQYVESLPPARTPPRYRPSAEVRVPAQAYGAGGWVYDPDTGRVSIDSKDADTRGSQWSEY
jgi:Tfp pilus assembly protein PilE